MTNDSCPFSRRSSWISSPWKRAAPSLELSPDYHRGVPGAEPYPLWITPDHKLSVADVMAVASDEPAGSSAVAFAVQCSSCHGDVSVDEMREMLKRGGAPTTLAEIGRSADEARLSLVWARTMRRRYTSLDLAEQCLDRVDQLTGLLNRRAFYEQAEGFGSFSERHGDPLALDLRLEDPGHRLVRGHAGHAPRAPFS